MRRISIVILLACAAIYVPSVSATLMATVACGASCTITPDGGPVALDPTNFALDVDWSPQHIELIEPPDDRGQWRLVLTFGTTSGEAVNGSSIGALTLNEMGGVPIGPLNEQFDDLDQQGTNLIVTFDIFGPESMSSFFAHGFSLASGLIESVDPNSNPLTGFQWISGEISVDTGRLAEGLWHIPEPTTVALLGLGLAGIGYNRKRKAT